MFHWGGKRKKKNVTDTINTFKLWELLTSPSRLNTGGYHYIRFILSTGNGKSVQHVISVEGKLFRLQFSWTKRRQLGTLKVPLRRFFVKNIPKRVLCYHLPCSLQIFIKDWACFSVRGKNPKKKNGWLPPIFVDLSCPFKDLNFFLHGCPNVAQKTSVFSMSSRFFLSYLTIFPTLYLFLKQLGGKIWNVAV